MPAVVARISVPPVTLTDLAALLRPLLDLPIERVLVSHGQPVLAGGCAALTEAIG